MQAAVTDCMDEAARPQRHRVKINHHQVACLLIHAGAVNARLFANFTLQTVDSIVVEGFANMDHDIADIQSLTSI